MSTSNLWCLTSGIFLFIYKAAGLICFFMDVSKNSWFLYLLKIHFEHQLQLLCQGQESGERVVYKYGQWSSSYESGKKAECSLKVLQFCKLLCWLTVQEWLRFLSSSASVQCFYTGQRDKTHCFTFPSIVCFFLNSVSSWNYLYASANLSFFKSTVLTCNHQVTLFM